MPSKYKKHEAKDWARQNWHGLCDVIIPSFSSDLKRLNESGIRHDVRPTAIRQGDQEIRVLPLFRREDRQRLPGMRAAGVGEDEPVGDLAGERHHALA